MNKSNSLDAILTDIEKKNFIRMVKPSDELTLMDHKGRIATIVGGVLGRGCTLAQFACPCILFLAKNKQHLYMNVLRVDVCIVKKNHI